VFGKATKALTVTVAAAAATVGPAVHAQAATKHHSKPWYQTSNGPRAYARRHTNHDQYRCLVKLWDRESRWRVHAENPSSGAYGIPQANPGSKMRSAGADWRHNGHTQVDWGLHYIKRSYGSPCHAWTHSQRHGWY
jgi:hypothetical protein